jgi:heterodisulfide reductase subunit A
MTNKLKLLPLLNYRHEDCCNEGHEGRIATAGRSASFPVRPQVGDTPSEKDFAMQHAPNGSTAPKAAPPVGAVMVVGGGIAGMQASLDLAASGYYVHLVERSSAIGGLMSQLDKTFPTNDCAM